jgi:hypothetical protein
LAGSIDRVLPVALVSIQDVTSTAGGIAAAVAIGAFIGQPLTSFAPASDRRRRRDTAIGGFAGLAAMIALILLSVSGW